MEKNGGTVMEIARRAKIASGALARLTTEQKNGTLLAMADALASRAAEILAANRKDADAAHEEVRRGGMSAAMASRLKLDEAKLAGIAEGIRQVAALEDPVGKVTMGKELDDGLRLYRVNCPIGVVGVIFESRPDVLPQIVSLCFKAGNAVLLKGGREAENSNRVLFDILHDVSVRRGVSADAMALLESREDVEALLKAEGAVDLIVPRGSNALVRHIQQNTTIPVLGHSAGVCHVYVDRSADLAKAAEVAVDSKVQYPAACNAAEAILVHEAVAGSFLPALADRLKERGVEIRCDAETIAQYNLKGAVSASGEDRGKEYSDLIVYLKVVGSIDDAIAYVNRHGSRHTEAIVTEDPAAYERYFAEVDAAGVYLNASTRFADGFRYGFGAEVGISTGKLHPRGPVGLEGLVTYKYKLIGDGHVVSAYSGPAARRFTHTGL